ncbi:phosphomannomutase/phosphoglucomutase [Clostridium psychrophilum]|nr:phosphomannomutase/phosphoglucomutase [Clostridium psychrophilum]
MAKWYKLQSGTDIRGIATEGSKNEVNLTPKVAKFIAYGFVKWLRNEKKVNFKDLKVAVGIDSRLSGPELKSSFIDALSDLGCNVYDCGMCTTPAMFMTTIFQNYECDASIMITASHLPYYYNGFKFFTREGGCEKDDIKNILSIASEEKSHFCIKKGEIFKINFIEEYSKDLVLTIRKGVASSQNYDKPLLGFKLNVDAGNGAGGFFADKVLKVLGADITGSQFTQPDGRFPNHIPNPEDKKAMESISQSVLTNHADLGIIFDTDVDRAAIVDSNGMQINKNALIALVSAIVLEEHPKTVIVTDSVTSTGLSEFISRLGGIHHRFKRGYRNVIDEAIRLNSEGKECYLAIETSGHAALKEKYFLDDGAYLIAKILIKMAKLNLKGKKLQDLIKDLKIPCESLDSRLTIKNNNSKKYGTLAIKGLEKYVKKIDGWSLVPNNYEGIKVHCDELNGDGWFLLRLSLHEPVLSLNMESDSNGGIKTTIGKLMPFFNKYNELDTNIIKTLKYSCL